MTDTEIRYRNMLERKAKADALPDVARERYAQEYDAVCAELIELEAQIVKQGDVFKLPVDCLPASLRAEEVQAVFVADGVAFSAAKNKDVAAFTLATDEWAFAWRTLLASVHMLPESEFIQQMGFELLPDNTPTPFDSR